MATDEASGDLIGACLGLFLFGFYSCLLVVTLWKIKRRPRLYTVATLAVLAIYFLNLCDSVVSLVRVYRAYVAFPGYSSDYLVRFEGQLLSTLHGTFWLISSGIADTIFLWRLWVIWSRSRGIAIFIIVLFICGLSGGLMTLVFNILNVTEGFSAANFAKRGLATKAVLGFEIVAHWVVSALIIGKLYFAGSRTQELTETETNRYLRVILAIVESGIALTFASVAYIILATKSPSMSSILGYPMVRIVGIVPLLILLQLSMGYTQPYDSVNMTLTEVAFRGQTVASQRTKRTQHEVELGPDPQTATVTSQDDPRTDINMAVKRLD